MLKLTKAELIILIEEAIEVDSGTINVDSTSENIDEWDSLGHLNFLIALDSRCDGAAGEISELATTESVKDIIDILQSNSLLQD